MRATILPKAFILTKAHGQCFEEAISGTGMVWKP